MTQGATTLLLYALSLPALLLLQTKPDTLSRPESPVFKNYRSRTPTPVIEQSDATYQLWQGFRLQQEANAGNAVSQFELSIRYLTGRGFKPDTVKAAYWTMKAANQNHLLARYNLAIFQFNGWGTQWNPFEAYRNFRFTAEHGVPSAQFALAQLLIENLVVPQNWHEAYRWAKAAADSGYAPAREALSFFEQRGFRSPDSTSPPAQHNEYSPAPTATSFLEPLFLDFSADTTHDAPDSMLYEDLIKSLPPALADTVSRLFTPTGEPRPAADSSQLLFLRRTAEAGSPEALTLLGRCYEEGTRCAYDVVQAAACYLRAVRLDSRRAHRLLTRLLTDAFVANLKTGVAQNNAAAMYVWASLVALGYDRRLTEAQALRLLEQAAAAHYIPALLELGLAHSSGRWVTRSEQHARQFWQRAANLGSLEARIRLVVDDLKKGGSEAGTGIALLRSAVDQGSVLAEVALARCYERGMGVPQNRGEAARLYRSAAQRGSQDAFYALLRMHDEIRPEDRQFKIAR